MKFKYIFIFVVLATLVVGYMILAQEKDGGENYGIIQGDNVNMRAKPDVKSKVVERLEKHEFVYCMDKTEGKSRIGNEEEHWYKVKDCDGKEGWVFGKYIKCLNPSIEPDKYYRKMIYVDIVERSLCKTEYIIKIHKLSYENDHYIIDFEKKEKPQYYSKCECAVMDIDYLSFYRIIDGIFTKTIDTNSFEYIFYKDYIILYSKEFKNGFTIFNTKEFTERLPDEPYLDIPCKYYKGTGFYLSEDVLDNIPDCNVDKKTALNCMWNSEMELNPETMEVVVNVRKEKDKLLKQERYRFKDGKFIKIE